MAIERMLNDPADPGPDGAVLTVREVLLNETRTGLPAEIACQFAGVSLRSFRRWVQDGRTVLRRLNDQPDTELTDGETELAQFATDVSAAQAFWLRNANVVMERSARQRRKTSTKVKTERRMVNGQPVDVEVERTVTTEDLPIELGPLMWRMSKLAPAQYGPVTRVELTGAEGGPLEVDIGARLDEVLSRIAESLAVEPAEPGPDEPAEPGAEPEAQA